MAPDIYLSQLVKQKKKTMKEKTSHTNKEKVQVAHMKGRKFPVLFSDQVILRITVYIDCQFGPM